MTDNDKDNEIVDLEEGPESPSNDPEKGGTEPLAVEPVLSGSENVNLGDDAEKGDIEENVPETNGGGHDDLHEDVLNNGTAKDLAVDKPEMANLENGGPETAKKEDDLKMVDVELGPDAIRENDQGLEVGDEGWITVREAGSALSARSNFGNIVTNLNFRSNFLSFASGSSSRSYGGSGDSIT